MKERSEPVHINRRSFLKGSAATVAGAGASAGASAATSALGNDDSSAAPSLLVPTVIHHAPAVVDGTLNPIVAENQMPGAPDWGITRLQGDIEGYASETSVVAGNTITFFVRTAAATFDLLVYRAGYYDGIGARLIAEVRGVGGVVQPPPVQDDFTGLASCAKWTPSHQMTVPDTWVTGIYFVKLWRPDTGGEGCIYFTVREDDAAQQRRGGNTGSTVGSDILFQQSVTTYQAYNPYGGKSLYQFNSSQCHTLSEGPRAVKVSFDRPYAHPLYGQNHFFLGDFPVVYWLEAQGYDVSYCTSLDTHRSGKPGEANGLLGHRTFLSVGHDEYWSQEMRDAIMAARDSGVHLAFLSSNVSYWRVRLEPDPHTGRPDRVLCCYKTAESGAADPISPTSTWRDPAIQQPENSVVGIQYVGDNGSCFFPIRVSAAQGKDRIYRHTPLTHMEPAPYTDVGHRLVGWEWDSVVANGFEPPNLTVLASTPTYGNVLDDVGRFYITGKASSSITRYTAASGASVFAVGTNQWGWGLAVFEPDIRVQQVMCNMLADMGALPATPDDALVLDAPAAAPSKRRFQDGTQPELDFIRTEPQAKFGLSAIHSTGALPATSADPVISNVSFAADRNSITLSFETDVETLGQVWMRIAPTRSDYRLSADLGWRLPMDVSNISEPYATRHRLLIQSLDPGHTYYATLVAMNRDLRVTILDEQRVETAPGNAVDTLKYSARTLYRSLPCWVREHGPLAVFGVVAVAASGVLWRLRRVRQKRTPWAEKSG